MDRAHREAGAKKTLAAGARGQLRHEKIRRETGVTRPRGCRESEQVAQSAALTRHRNRQYRAMARLTANFGCRRDSRRVAIHVATAGECNRLRGQCLAVSFSASLTIRFSARADFGRSIGGLRMMGLRYAPGKASQFTHGLRSLECCPALRGGDCRLVYLPEKRWVPCQACRRSAG